MKPKVLITFLIASILLLKESEGQSYHSGKGMIYVYAGTTNVNINTSAYFNISPAVTQNFPGINTGLDLEDDIKLPASATLFYCRGYLGWRLQIVGSFFSLHRSGESTLTKSFALGDNHYDINTHVKCFFNTEYYSGSLRLSILRNNFVTLGISLGARYLRFNAGIDADSYGIVFSQKGSFDVPSLLPGLHGSVYVLKNLLVRASIDYLSIHLNEAKGKFMDTQFSAEYYLLKYLGVGAGYSIYELDAANLPDNPVYLRDINYRLSGLNIFAAFRF